MCPRKKKLNTLECGEVMTPTADETNEALWVGIVLCGIECGKMRDLIMAINTLELLLIRM